LQTANRKKGALNLGFGLRASSTMDGPEPAGNAAWSVSTDQDICCADGSQIAGANYNTRTLESARAIRRLAGDAAEPSDFEHSPVGEDCLQLYERD
jgi:hypothetical protein